MKHFGGRTRTSAAACLSGLALVVGLAGCDSPGAGSNSAAPPPVEIPAPAPPAESAPPAEAAGSAPTTEPETTAAAPADAASPTVEPAASTDAPAASEPAPPAEAAAPAADAPPKYEILVKDRTFQPVGPQRAWRVGFEDLDLEKVLNMKKAVPEAAEQMPEWMKSLSGRRIRLRGFMVPSSVQVATKIPRFILSRDTSACCFGPNPTPYYLVDVVPREGSEPDYIENRAFDVEGVFHIDVKAIPGTQDVFRVYRLDDAVVVKK